MTEASQNPVHPTPESGPSTITPALALELRVRQLSNLLCGQPNLSTETRAAQPIRHQLDSLESHFSNIASNSDGVRRFVDTYDVNAPLLNLSLTTQPRQPEEPDWLTKAILVLEQEHDILTIERDLREIQVLVDQQGADQAGKLENCKALRQPLERVRDDLNKRAKTMDSLEDRATQLLGDYNAYVRSSLLMRTRKTLMDRWFHLLSD